MNTLVNNQWISLTEYSNKYKISISTLRRRIRDGFLNVRLESGKYFLKDEGFEKPSLKHKSSLMEGSFSPSALKPPAPLPTLPSEGVAEKERGPGTAVRRAGMEKVYTALQQNETLLHQVLHSQKTLKTQAHEKDKILYQLQNQLADLKTLVALLEKENKELKSLLYQEKEMEDWLHGS